ncbi:PAQR family membrane homeostasis protein TrhA [Geotoga petraea]|jgi:hemolysin III|uniref:Hemolysin III n=1 Tax=Geotoga petraea TaxID=28234 RepID=A0A1G6PT41_9BACT|nr:hemolysin III family protein [Geotoga petraea]TGG86881.1 hemolysin III family protein [Geotoga petraea]SDC83198.1 hemolysin III [Geotoga petraea]
MADKENIEKYTKNEEIANTIIHGIGILLAIASLVLMVVFAALKGTAWHVVGATVFGISLIIMYTFSTLYHGVKNRRAKDILEICDHSAIYFLIAGTYTPFTLVTLRGTMGWTLFGITWGLAIVGVIFKIFFVKKFMFISTLIYIGMGWLVVIGWNQLVENLPFWGIFWLVLGGILYTFGTIFYVWRKMKYHHALWHVFVLAGSISHVFSVLFYVIPIFK